MTALFRHPLGIPIPHTAIIPTRKERIALICGTSSSGISSRARCWRSGCTSWGWRNGWDRGWRCKNSRAIARQLVRAAAGAAEAVPEDTARAFVDRSIVGRLRGIPAAPVAARAIESLMNDGKHQELLDRIRVS